MTMTKLKILPPSLPVCLSVYPPIHIHLFICPPICTHIVLLTSTSLPLSHHPTFIHMSICPEVLYSFYPMSDYNVQEIISQRNPQNKSLTDLQSLTVVDSMVYLET